MDRAGGAGGTEAVFHCGAPAVCSWDATGGRAVQWGHETGSKRGLRPLPGPLQGHSGFAVIIPQAQNAQWYLAMGQGASKACASAWPSPGIIAAMRLLYHSLTGKTILSPQIGRIPQKEGASSAAVAFCGGKTPLFWQFSQKAVICPARWRNWRYDRPFLPLCAPQFRQKADCKGRLPGGTIEATSENRHLFES